MNKVILMGRLTRDPQVSWGTKNNSQEQICVARYALAVDRRGKDAGTDYPSIVAFGKAGEFAEKYLHKGTKIVVTGRIQTGSYTNKDGVKVYTTDIVAEDQDLQKARQQQDAPQTATAGEIKALQIFLACDKINA